MILAVDIGNTNIKFGIYEKRFIKLIRLATDSTRTAVQYAADISSVFSFEKIDISQITGAVVSSVVPPLTVRICEAVKAVTGALPLILGIDIKTGLNIKIHSPSSLGADLIAGAVGAKVKYTAPCIIFDLGTANTVSVIDKNGDFIGVAIMAGVNISLSALTDKTAQLPPVSVDFPVGVIGKNTHDSMISGAVGGAAGAIDGCCERIELELGASAACIATGGISKFILPYCRRKITYDEYLALDGLIEIYRLNKG